MSNHASDFETFAFAIKDRYDRVSHVENLTLANRPLLAMINKDEDFQGEGTHIPLIYANAQGIAANSLVTAQNNQTNLKGKKFILKAGDYQGVVSMGDKVITASRGNPGAFLKNKSGEMDSVYEQMADNISTYLYGNSGNAIGQIVAVSPDDPVAGQDTITLGEASQGMNFEVGMFLTFSTDDGSDTGHVETGVTGEVIEVHRDTGNIVVQVAGGNPAIDDFIFRDGDFSQGGDEAFIFHGLSDFLWPDGAPPPIYGMIRTDDPIRLAGARIPAAELSGLNMQERITLLGAWMAGRYKGPGPTHGFLHPEDFQNLCTALQSQGIRPLQDDSARWNFMHLQVVMGGQLVKLYSDRFCPRGTGFFLRLKDWTLHSMLKLIHPISQDGLTLLRNPTENSYEYRIVSYPSLCTVAPGWSGRVGLAS